MILESIITTINEDGSPHVSAIGPHVDEQLIRWTLKPFTTSKTFQNLRRTNRCVIHITDDALLMAQVVAHRPIQIEMQLENDFGYVISYACRVFGLSLSNWEIVEPRSSVNASVSWQRELRPFWGWNRAKHAILELAIASTRVHLLPSDEIHQLIDHARLMVKKTAGESEIQALEVLEEFVRSQLAQSPPKG